MKKQQQQSRVGAVSEAAAKTQMAIVEHENIQLVGRSNAGVIGRHAKWGKVSRGYQSHQLP